MRHDLLDDCDIGCGKRDKGNFPPLAVLSTPCFRAGGWPCSVWLRVEEKSPPYEAALHCNHKRAREKSVSAVSGPLAGLCGHHKGLALALKDLTVQHARSEMTNSLGWGF